MSASAINYQLGAAYQGKFAEVPDVATGGTYNFTGTRSHVICSSSGAGTKKIPNAAPGTEFVVIASGTLSLTTAAGVAIVTLATGQSVVLRANTTTSWQVVGGSIFLTQFQSTLGHIPLPLSAWRSIGSNNIPDANSAGAADASGGVLASDSAPALIRVNTSTDKALRILWAASSSVEITQDFIVPPDYDDTAVIKINLLANMAATNDAPELTIDTNMGVGQQVQVAAVGPISGTTVTLYTATILSAAEALPYPNHCTVSITPGTHGTDALRLYGSWISYTKKLLTS